MNFIERIKPTTVTRALLSSVPYILIQPQALHKMFQYVSGCSDEIGWMGTAYREGREIIIDNVFLFDQEVHATTTEITPDGLSDFAMELMQQPDGVDIWNNLKMWGHSHVNMGITPSGQDDKQMETFKEGGHDWFIRLIANKKGELKIDLYDYATGVIYLDLPWEALESEAETHISMEISLLEKKLEELRESVASHYSEPIKEEIKVKVRKKVYPMSQQGSNWAQRGSLAGTKTHGGETTDTKKKTNIPERKSEEIDTNTSEYDYFETDDDVRKEFSITELITLAFCKDFEELEKELDFYGWVGCFTTSDVERIYRVAHKVAFQYGDITEEDEFYDES
jgi:hypothetical protein